jgi:hypothetical protein
VLKVRVIDTVVAAAAWAEAGAFGAAETSTIIPFEKRGFSASIMATYGIIVGGIKATISRAAINAFRCVPFNIAVSAL